MRQVFTIVDILLCERPVKLRLPFQFGNTVVTETSEAHVRVTLQAGKEKASGQSAQLMVPRWFDKNSDLTNADTIEDLRSSLREVARAAIGKVGTVAELSAQLRLETRKNLPSRVPDLASAFGPATVEMALIDAACRSANLSFPAAAKVDVFGLAELLPKDVLADDFLQTLSEIKPQWSIRVRHTVGFDSPLESGDVSARPDDAPVALSEVIDAYGISHFKIKLKGDPKSDVKRLLNIGKLLDGLRSYRVTLDANEQYDHHSFETFLDLFRDNVSLKRLWAMTDFVEQPFAREVALAPKGPMLSKDMPIIIDESDDNQNALKVALSQGWAGTSVKSCKGVLRALLNKTRINVSSRQGRPSILSAEDLTCQPGLCWQQDSLMGATIGAEHIERNGHFFAGGMQGASEVERQSFLSLHSDIYKPSESGPRLRIVDGHVQIGSLNSVGFASRVMPDLTKNQTIEF